jgi:hypothetical protein
VNITTIRDAGVVEAKMTSGTTFIAANTTTVAWRREYVKARFSHRRSDVFLPITRISMTYLT